MTTNVSRLNKTIGVEKAWAIRCEVIRLKHEVKDALRRGVTTISVVRLNERLQHIAKIPRPGLPKLRCNGRCKCSEPIA